MNFEIRPAFFIGPEPVFLKDQVQVRVSSIKYTVSDTVYLHVASLLFLLTILTGKNCVFTCSFFIVFINDTHREKLCFIQFSIRIAGWLLLTVTFISASVYTVNQVILYILLSRMKSTDVWKMWLIKQMVAPSSKFYGKIWVGFCLNTGKHFFLEVSF